MTSEGNYTVPGTDRSNEVPGLTPVSKNDDRQPGRKQRRSVRPPRRGTPCAAGAAGGAIAPAAQPSAAPQPNSAPVVDDDHVDYYI